MKDWIIVISLLIILYILMTLFSIEGLCQVGVGISPEESKACGTSIFLAMWIIVFIIAILYLIVWKRSK